VACTGLTKVSFPKNAIFICGYEGYTKIINELGILGNTIKIDDSAFEKCSGLNPNINPPIALIGLFIILLLAFISLVFFDKTIKKSKQSLVNMASDSETPYKEQLINKAKEKKNKDLSAYKTVYRVIYFIGALNFVLGIVSYFFKINILQENSFGFVSAFAGLIYLLLGYFVKRKSITALTLTIIIYGIDSLLLVLILLFSAKSTDNSFMIANYLRYIVIMRFIFIQPMFKGVTAIKHLKKIKKQKKIYEGQQQTSDGLNIKLCEKCGCKFSEHCIVCPECGTNNDLKGETKKTYKCANCGSILQEEQLFCQECGTRVTDNMSIY